MHYMNYAKREQEKPLFFKPTLRSRFTPSRAQCLCLACQHLIQIGLTTNCVKKVANRKRRPTYVLVTLRDSNTILCTNSPFADALERQRYRQSHKSFMSFRKRREILFRLETQTLITKKVFLWDRSSVMLRKLHTNPSKFFFNRRKTKLEGFVWSFLSITA